MEFLTIAQAANESGKTENEIRLLVRQKKLPTLTIGSTLFIHRQHLNFAVKPPFTKKGHFLTAQ